MKKLLSITLSLALILPCIGAGTKVLAAERGYFGGLNNSEVTSFTQDFETPFTLNNTNSSTAGHDGVLNYQGLHTRPQDRGGLLTSSYRDTSGLFAPKNFDGSTNTKHFVVQQTGGNAANERYTPTLGVNLNITNVQPGEVFHNSFYIKNNDFICDKTVAYSYKNLKGNPTSLVTLKTNGKMVIGTEEINCTLDRWYKIDVVATNDADTTNGDSIAIYLDGSLVTTLYPGDILSVPVDFVASELEHLIFRVDSMIRKDGQNIVLYPYNTNDAPSSELCVDNVTGNFYRADETMPPITAPSHNWEYVGYDVREGLSDGTVDGLVGAVDNNVVDYLVTSGVYGKESTDNSMKLSSDEALAATDSITAYSFDMAKIKADKKFPVGAELKFSLSYAYSKDAAPGDGKDLFKLGNEDFFSISRTGVLSAANGSGTFTLANEKWYNIDAILKVNEDKDLEYVININGRDPITGTLTTEKDGDYAVIPSLKLDSYMDYGKNYVSYIDDVYIGHFIGETAPVNPPVELNVPDGADFDLNENGKIFIPAGYDAGDLYEYTDDANAPKMVIRDGGQVTSGTAENALVVVGDLCPVYGYAYVKIKYTTPSASINSGNGTVDISASIENNQAEAVEITLITAVYSDGRILMVKSDYANCTTGTHPLLVEIPTANLPADAVFKIYTINGWTNKIPIFDNQADEINYNFLS